MPIKLPKGALDILENVKHSEQVKEALALLEKYLTPENQNDVVRQLVNVPPKEFTLDHMALSGLGDRVYLTYPGIDGPLASERDRLNALKEWRDSLEKSKHGIYKMSDDGIGDWFTDGAPLNKRSSFVLPARAITKSMDNLAVQLPHPLDLFRSSGSRTPENYVKKPWHSTTLDDGAYDTWIGPSAGFRVPGGTPLVFNQSLADKNEILAPMNDLVKYRFKAKGGLVRAGLSILNT